MTCLVFLSSSLFFHNSYEASLYALTGATHKGSTASDDDGHCHGRTGKVVCGAQLLSAPPVEV